MGRSSSSRSDALGRRVKTTVTSAPCGGVDGGTGAKSSLWAAAAAELLDRNNPAAE